MENLIKIYYDWEIQLEVLLSLGIQIFLFFTGGLRRRGINMFLRFLIWIAYLGADMVALYALGYLSRHVNVPAACDTLRGKHPLAFFWAPFFIVHLGGQDTITAFAMEDNNLWLRHLLNLIVQVVLASYVFGKSMGRHEIKLLVSGILVFILGIIKYVERIRSLNCGCLKSLESSMVYHFESNNISMKGRKVSPQVLTLIEDWMVSSGGVEMIPQNNVASYSDIVFTSLNSMKRVLNIFGGHTRRLGDPVRFGRRHFSLSWQPKIIRKVLEIQLGLMYADLYTKAYVLRMRSGVILRCFSHISMLVAFMLFLAVNKQSYSRVDIVITYSLFIGGLCLEVCAVFISMMSPWTWKWLKHRGWHRLAHFCWLLFSNGLIGCPEEKSFWSTAMGQFKLVSWLWDIDRTRLELNTNEGSVMNVATKLVRLIGVKEEKLFWLGKLLYMNYINADKMLECLIEGVCRFAAAGTQQDAPKLPNLNVNNEEHKEIDTFDFGYLIVFMHIRTETYLDKTAKPEPHLDSEGVTRCPDAPVEEWTDKDAAVEVCRKLSYYMMHLLVNHPSLLPLSGSAADALKRRDIFFTVVSENYRFNPSAAKETVEEIKEVWIRLIIYAAAKSRPEMHAVLLARGGEPLTFVWLLLSLHGMGDLGRTRIELAGRRPGSLLRYAFEFDG